MWDGCVFCCFLFLRRCCKGFKHRSGAVMSLVFHSDWSSSLFKLPNWLARICQSGLPKQRLQCRCVRPGLHFSTAPVLLSTGRGVFPLAVPVGPSLKNTQFRPFPPVPALLCTHEAWMTAEREREWVWMMEEFGLGRETYFISWTLSNALWKS